MQGLPELPRGSKQLEMVTRGSAKQDESLPHAWEEVL